MYHFRKDNINIYIGHIPKRKKPALFIEYGTDSPIYPVAYFQSEADMHIFRRALTDVFKNAEED